MRLKILVAAALLAPFPIAAVGVNASVSNSADAVRSLRDDAVKIGVFVAGIRIGNLNLAGRSDGRSYGTSAVAQETGLASWLSDFRYSASARGWVRKGGLEPLVFEESINENGKHSSTSIKYKNGVPYEVALTGELDEGETPLDPLRQGGVLDPLTAMYLMTRDVKLGEACRSSFDVFDGVRRSRISLGNPGALDDGFECRSSYERIEGWTEEEMNEQKIFPFELRYVQLEGRPEWYRMTELSAPTSIGRLRLRRLK